jgi:magnesium-protoporphyrin IX monomethyl ester (oxidative) cyclase
MRILLIHPAANILENRRERKYAAHPLGAAYIAAVLERDGHEVKIYDALIHEGYDREEVLRPGFIRYGASCEQILNQIADYRPDVVGISSLHSNRRFEIMEATRAAKQCSPDIVTVVGAGYPSSQPDECLLDPNCDYIIMGEGEQTISQFIRKLQGKDYDFSSLDGFGYKKNGKAVVNPKKTYIKNLDDYPFPAYHLLDMNEYTRIGTGMGRFQTKHYTLFNTSRGCPHACHFCGKDPIIGTGYRKRSIDTIMAEVAMLKKDYGIQELQIVDFHAMADRRHWHNFLHALIRSSSRMNIALPHGMALESLDDETLELLAASGCDHLYMAIESANQLYLDTLGKGITISHLEHVIAKAHSLKMTAGGYFVIGIPGERWKDILATTELAVRLDLDDANFFIATPLPGTRMYKECEEQGLILPVFNTARIRYSLANLKGPDYSSEMLEEIRYTAWLKVREKNKQRLLQDYGKQNVSDKFYRVPEWSGGCGQA